MEYAGRNEMSIGLGAIAGNLDTHTLDVQSGARGLKKDEANFR